MSSKTHIDFESNFSRFENKFITNQPDTMNATPTRIFELAEYTRQNFNKKDDEKE